MTRSINRRHFLMSTAATAAAAAVAPAQDNSPGNHLTLGIIGTGGRGTGVAQAFARQANVTVTHVCDVDSNHARQAAAAVGRVDGVRQAPQAVGDLRRILDDRNVDAVYIATPNHWHAPAAILACAAGKHVYVEKPCSYNPREGELLVAAARRHDRKVQMGNQRRSFPKIQEAMASLRDGSAIGRVYLAEAWYLNTRPSTGVGREAAVPAGLDYDMWQGPAPRKPFHTNYLPYTWHWFWHWGNGELGNNGIHMIDVCRWGLGTELPTRVTSTGGRYRYEDDQETPDTNLVTFEFPDRKMIRWEGLSCNRYPRDTVPDVLFHGDRGSLAINNGSYTVYDASGQEIWQENGQASDNLHFRNFLEGVRGNARLNAEITEGAKSTLHCHLGNIAYRVGHSIACDGTTGRIQNDAPAMAMWQREYHDGWQRQLEQAAGV